jgi:hypothetical protein
VAEVPGPSGLGAIEARVNANIGGGYNGVGSRQGDGGDPSDVALNWMLQQDKRISYYNYYAGNKAGTVDT